MHAARRQLQKVWRVPQHTLVGGQLDWQPPQTLLELSDIGLPGLQMDAAGFEQRPTVRLRPHREQSEKAGLAAARLADDEE